MFEFGLAVVLRFSLFFAVGWIYSAGLTKWGALLGLIMNGTSF